MMRPPNALRAAAAAAAVFVCACSARPRTAAPAPADPLAAVVSAILSKAGDIPDGTLAVHDITGVSGETTPEGRLVAERLTSRLASSGKVRVIERRRLEAALKELSLSASGAVDEAGLAKAGFLSGAGAVVTGTLARLDGGYELNARAINVATGDVIAAATALLHIDLASGGGTVRRLPAPRPSPPAVPAGPTEPPPGWKVWPGPGRFDFDGRELRYCLAARQHDGFSESRDGYIPGLTLEREITGDNWTVDVSARYEMSGASGQWLSATLWFGEKDVRPALYSADLALNVRMNQNGDSMDFTYWYYPGGELVVTPPSKSRKFRFERKGSFFSVYGQDAGGEYSKTISLFSPAAAKAPAQKLVIAGQAFGSITSCADYEYIKLDGKPLF
ncbi:MAG: putative lipoprotein [Elusimicrobia bacterium]|nr:MAG: putative lipoprotein [Elusimicrobiota bacterium]KAF0154896.1 MAG: putative lipoprotein [Elusimicrobiota bacterium]